MDVVTVERLDHLGIIAGVIQDLSIIEMIDGRIIPDAQEGITTGEAVAAKSLPLRAAPAPQGLAQEALLHQSTTVPYRACAGWLVTPGTALRSTLAPQARRTRRSPVAHTPLPVASIAMA